MLIRHTPNYFFFSPIPLTVLTIRAKTMNRVTVPSNNVSEVDRFVALEINVFITGTNATTKTTSTTTVVISIAPFTLPSILLIGDVIEIAYIPLSI